VAVERLALPLLAATLAFGCNGEESNVIDWDLSQSHTRADVEWPRPELDAAQITDVGEVSIALPEGRSFSSRDEVRAVGLESRGDQVTTVQLDSDPLSTDDAYELAKRWAREWGLPQRPLDDWYRERRAGRERGDEDVTTTAESLDNSQRIGRDGPTPSLQILYSFRENERPSFVSLQFFW
jgi:hypothetical protein